MLIQRTDISFALQYGRPIHFFRDRISEVEITLVSRGLSLDRSSAACAIRHSGLDPDLHEILVDVTSVASLLNNMPASLTLDIVTFQETIVSICSRLIRFHPLQSLTHESDVDAAYHIGLTIFTMTLFMQFDNRRVMQYELVSLRLKDVLDHRLDEVGDDLLLWLLFIGGIWISGGTDRFWLGSRIKSLSRTLGINNWAEVHTCISKFPWIGNVHDELGLAVWDAVSESSQLP